MKKASLLIFLFVFGCITSSSAEDEGMSKITNEELQGYVDRLSELEKEVPKMEKKIKELRPIAEKKNTMEYYNKLITILEDYKIQLAFVKFLHAQIQTIYDKTGNGYVIPKSLHMELIRLDTEVKLSLSGIPILYDTLHNFLKVENQ